MRYRRVRHLFKKSRGSLGNREMVKRLRKEGYQVGRYIIKKLPKKETVKFKIKFKTRIKKLL